MNNVTNSEIIIYIISNDCFEFIIKYNQVICRFNHEIYFSCILNSNLHYVFHD